ncbi:rod shape-determining protein MreD [Piscibacillus halophilus]|uniref:rod shape-determining protein MreD n=1 Tax=Piscibacillus halophilus TaxID=571933 RepID=UPI00158DBE6C|nr:rod shape-determining protein MreD [Piscibacillus halophilus]
MRFLYLPLTLLILLVLESVAVRFIPKSITISDLIYIPHWILVFSLLILLFYDRNHTYHGIINGVIFGALFELVYTDLVGVYLLAYGIALYLVHLLTKVLQQNFAVSFLLVTLSIVVAEFILYFIYSLVGQVDMTVNQFVQLRLIPTTLSNILFLLIIYPFFVKRLTKWQEEDQQIK